MESVMAMHDRQLAEHGGGEGIREAGLLESALHRPLDKFAYGQPDLCDLAAAYAYGLARNHPFVDGNKRTALVASLTFLEINGLRTTSTQAENVAAFLALAAGELDEDALAAWLRKHAETV
ncbi:MAG TPA: type II toxin-antitoxin system death-on-curing family toxin [Aestuariivirgaceae bacterium]|nr:type II toxin-antitoxin system death-on-curing family toxin [Aestuariivirgaceae bacterium]